MRVLICGGRRFGYENDEWSFINEELSKLLTYDSYDHILIIHGAAKGVDTIAGEWADMMGFPSVAFPAEWEKYGLGAGSIRNKQMLDEGKPNWIIAFPGGPGTANMIKQGKRRGVKIKQFIFDARTPLDEALGS